MSDERAGLGGSEPYAFAAAGEGLAAPRDYFELLKPRVMSLVIFTALVGLVRAPGDVHPIIAFTALLCIAVGAGAKSQQALGTGVMGGMIAVVILALLMVPVFFVVVQRVLSREREKVVAADKEPPHASTQAT